MNGYNASRWESLSVYNSTVAREILSNLVNHLSLYLFDLHSVKYLSRCSLFLVLNTKWDCSFSCFQGRHMLELFSLFCSLHLISLSYFVLPKLHWIKLNKKSVTPWHYKQNYNIFKQHWPICSLEKFIWTVSILHSWCQCNDTPLVLLLAFAILFYWKTLW